MAFSWDDFREQKLVQWTAAYLPAAWVTYEALSQVGDNFAWPAVVMRVVTVILAAGLPTVMVLAWFHGEKGRQKIGTLEFLLLAGIAAGGALGIRLVMAAAAEPATATGPAADDILLNSMAVLPLANRSGDPDQEYFADGLTEEIMGALSRVPGLRLAARTSSFAFKSQNVTLDSVSRALGVRHVLDGSVLRQGDSLRISIALIDAVGGYELWNASYRGPATDVFAIERRIAQAVVDALPLDPVLLERHWDLPAGSTDLEAYDLFLLGKEAWNRRTGPELLRAVDLFSEATAIDPSYAPAWAALAETYAVLPGYTTVSARTSYDRLRETAGRALSLDSLNVQAHTALGYGAVWYGRDFPEGIRRMQRALDIDPDNANALHWQGEVLAHAGRFEDSWANFELALEVDPLSHVTRADYGQALQLAGRFEDAIGRLEELLAEAPGYLIGEYWLFYPALLTERYERAEELIRSVARGVGLDPEGMALAVRGVAGRVPRDRAVAALDAQPRSISGVGQVALTALYTRLDAVDRAFAMLQEESDTPVQVTIYLVTHPVFEPLRADPRFHALTADVRFP